MRSDKDPALPAGSQDAPEVHAKELPRERRPRRLPRCCEEVTLIQGPPFVREDGEEPKPVLHFHARENV